VAIETNETSIKIKVAIGHELEHGMNMNTNKKRYETT
jgi:hypothetical protein